MSGQDRAGDDGRAASTAPTESQHPERDEMHRQLARMLDEDFPSLELVEAVAGDRELTAEETQHVSRLKRRGDKFYSDLLFTLTHTFIPHETAPKHWESLLAHRTELEDRLGRDVGLSVAALDYFTNITHTIASPAVIGQNQLVTVAEIALEDGLTGLYDHATFMRRLEHELSRYRRYGDTFALILFDIDDFKSVNDTHGHQAGDLVLQRFAELLTDMTRDTSIAARYGGEEFALLEPRAGVADGLTLAERVRAAVEKTDFEGVRVTISGGVAGCPADGEDARTLVGAADRALYRSKRRGKNTVTGTS